MHVSYVYVSNRGGFTVAQYAMMSAALSQPRDRDFHLFCHRFDAGAETAPLAAAMRAAGQRLHVRPIEDAVLERIETAGRLPTTMYLRVAAITAVAPTTERVVYLDIDTLVFEDLGIETLDLEGRSIAAVLDMDLSDKGPFPDYVHKGLQDPAMRTRFFNSGVMVIDAARWPAADIQPRFLALISEHARRCPYKCDCPHTDQCPCNALFDNDWTPLPLSYNFQASGKFTPGWQTARLRHYVGSAKFLPLTLRRNDRRDLMLIAEISLRLGRPAPSRIWLYAMAFWLNALRNRGAARDMQRFIAFADPGRGEPPR